VDKGIKEIERDKGSDSEEDFNERWKKFMESTGSEDEKGLSAEKKLELSNMIAEGKFEEKGGTGNEDGADHIKDSSTF
jgi:hypothetical protein